MAGVSTTGRGSGNQVVGQRVKETPGIQIAKQVVQTGAVSVFDVHERQGLQQHHHVTYAVGHCGRGYVEGAVQCLKQWVKGIYVVSRGEESRDKYSDGGRGGEGASIKKTLI